YQLFRAASEVVVFAGPLPFTDAPPSGLLAGAVASRQRSASALAFWFRFTTNATPPASAASTTSFFTASPSSGYLVYWSMLLHAPRGPSTGRPRDIDVNEFRNPAPLRFRGRPHSNAADARVCVA